MSKETSDQEIPTSNPSINTEGGANIKGSIDTGGGDFIGRDLTILDANEETIDIAQLHKRPYIVRISEAGSTFGSVYTSGGHFIGRDLIINNLEVKDIENLQPEPCDPPCVPPYQGLLSFDIGDADRFFGRDTLIAEIIARLQHTNCLTVMGASGSGKSSVVRAGVVPAMLGMTDVVEDGELPTGNWQELILTPTSRPLSELAKILSPDNAVIQSQLHKQLQQLESTLAKSLNQLTASDNNNRLLIVDQFEELFTLCNDEEARQAFIKNLLYISRNPLPSLKIILILRADFYHLCLNYTDLARLIIQRQITVLQMEAAELAEAILRPAAKGIWQLQARLVDQILDDVGKEPGTLPLLSHALLETWNRRRLRVMTLSGYLEAGGIKGAIAKTAETTFANLNENEQSIAKRLFLRLTEPGQEGIPDTRRKVHFNEIEEDAVTQQVQHKLAQARLITADENGLEVAHEALIREWSSLKEWLDKNRKGIIIHHHLINAAQTWHENGEETSFLYTGSRLEETEQWSIANSSELNELERSFLAASLLAEKRRARNRRYLRIGSVIGFSFLVILSIIIVVINNARSDAVTGQELAVAAQATSDINAALASTREKEAQAAQETAQELKTSIQASQMAEAAQAELSDNAELALLLAVAGMRVNIQADAQYQLAESLQSPYRTTLYGHENMVNSVVFSPDGQTILTAGCDERMESTSPCRHGTARLWDLQGNELAILRGHEGGVNSAVFSSDGQYILTAGDDGTARLWDRQGETLVVFGPQNVPIVTAAFSPDNQRILTAGGFNHTASLWDIQGNQLVSLEGHEEYVYSAVFSPDGQTLLTASRDGTVRLWDNQGSELSILRGHESWIYSAIFNPDGNLILTASLDGTARLWNEQGNELALLRGHENMVRSAVFSPDGEMIITAGGFDGTARLWDLQGNELAVLKGHVGAVNSALFSPNGEMILTTGEDGTARLWDRQGNELFTLQNHAHGAYLAVFHPNGYSILTTGCDELAGYENCVSGTVRLWNWQSNDFVVLSGHEGEVSSSAFSPDGQTIVTSGEDGTARLWDRDGNQITVLYGHEDMVNSVVFSPDGQTILTGSEDGTARLWDREGSQITVLYGHEHGVESAMFSPDGQKILTGGEDGTARLWDKQGNALAILQGHENLISSISFSPNGQTILTSSFDGTARLWDLHGKQLAILRRHIDMVNSATFSPDGQTILTSGGGDGTARLWNLQGDHLAVMMGHEDILVWSAIFSPDGQLIVTVGSDRTARLWDREGNELAVLRGHEDSVISAILSSDGQTLFTSSRDGTVRLWDLQGNRLATIRGHEGEVNSTTLSPDELTVLTSSKDGTARLWPYFNNKYMLQEAYWRIKRGFTEEECQQYFNDELNACPRTKDELFAPLANYLTEP